MQVLAPAFVDDLQQQEALERAHQLLAELGLARVVLLDRVLGHQRDQLRLVHPRALEDLLRDRDRVDRRQRRRQRVQIPVLNVVPRRVLLDRALQHRGDFAAGLREVGPLEHLVAQLVDHAALLVHHVVVLERVLAGEVVLLLDLALGALDLLGEHPGLDRLLVALDVDGAEAVEDAVDAVAREEADQLVLGGEEEAALARVALAPGAPAQLVVDPARLVTLSPDDEEASGLDHALAVLLQARLERGQQLDEVLVVGLVAGAQAELGALEARLMLGVAAQLDVDAAAGHVGRDRDRADPARFGNRRPLALRILRLRVEHGVLDAPPAQA